MIDLAALRAKLAAKKMTLVSSTPAIEVQEILTIVEVVENVPVKTTEVETVTTLVAPVVPVVNNTIGAGTTRTSQIDHLDFLSKLDELSSAILTQHPKMPVLLMLIHKQLRLDPELVTTLDEEAIGIIVNGLKIQTKTELVGTILKQSKTKDKKTKLSADMF